MRKLLASNWFIARRNGTVILVCVVMLAIAAFASLNNAYDRIWAATEYAAASGTQETEPPSVGFERIALTTVPALGIVFAFAISTLVNDDFAGGRIRDKIIGDSPVRKYMLPAFFLHSLSAP